MSGGFQIGDVAAQGGRPDAEPVGEIRGAHFAGVADQPHDALERDAGPGGIRGNVVGAAHCALEGVDLPDELFGGAGFYSHGYLK
ncbi:hypothetical protein AHIS1636_08780 [Arthrobacter mangrovi]|uniref:Uncharacterized protein n=1 Tax=Arthrobacter mangrovi TaxID=2966350 RepID=A0ABQ5MR32_9MICC|nr:hypothetical protein AHIS1636_08780 [Arthrobacter mangrovi]